MAHRTQESTLLTITSIHKGDNSGTGRWKRYMAQGMEEGALIQLNTTQPQKKMKYYHLGQHRWILTVSWQMQ